PWSEEEARKELLRGRLEGLGPVTSSDLSRSLAWSSLHVEGSLVALESEGFALRGRFTPGREGEEWCARRLLARIHRYTLHRLRQEIEPVSAVDFLRFLIAWHGVMPALPVREEGAVPENGSSADHEAVPATPDLRPEGAEGLSAVIEQLEAFEAPA